MNINPQNAMAYCNRGLAYVNVGKYELAINDYDSAIKINPQLAKLIIIVEALILGKENNLSIADYNSGNNNQSAG